jgi:hypothetical protein
MFLNKENDVETKNVKDNYTVKTDIVTTNIPTKIYKCDIDCNNKNKTIKSEKYELIPITDLQCKITIEKIQELYKEQGFYVKVIDIVKKKYITEYEIIFQKEISQFEILSVSDKIIENFSIDGVRIISNTKKNNRIFIQIPLKYEKTLTEM